MTLTINEETARKLKAFARGEMTWAEVEGFTWMRARLAMTAGCELAAAERLDEAAVVFEALVALNPKDSASQAALGTVYQKLGRPADAEAAYSAALRLDPQNAVAFANRGELRLKRGDKEGALDLAKAVEADPQGETAAGRRARALLRALALRIAAARAERD
jgi:Flp pilus assembly protein TadD